MTETVKNAATAVKEAVVGKPESEEASTAKSKVDEVGTAAIDKTKAAIEKTDSKHQEAAAEADKKQAEADAEKEKKKAEAQGVVDAGREKVKEAADAVHEKAEK